MANDLLQRLFEHSNWANQQLIEVCSQLNDEQLDAEPSSAMYGTIRQTLIHLVRAQVAYLKLLTRPVEERRQAKIPLAFADLALNARSSGEGLLELVGDGKITTNRIETTDGYWVEPWVVLVQAINHADEHREQVCSQLSALGVKSPALDGWSFGEASGALLPI
jgi:uncharacterized damage-inducible protein DinB